MKILKNKKLFFFSLVIFCIGLVLTGCSINSTAKTMNKPEIPTSYQTAQLNVDAKAAIAVDIKNGQILYAKNAKQALPIASMSKLITVYLTLDAIRDGKISWDTQVSPDSQILEVASNSDYANVPLKRENKYTVRQLYQATLIESANDAAMMLAKAVSGNQKDFVLKMRQQLKNWGITDAKIYTPSGLANSTLGDEAFDVSKNAENELSAYDMAIVARNLLQDFPGVVNTTKIANLNFVDNGQSTAMQNWNWMLPGLSQYSESYPVDGLKTGTTDAAGACFTSTIVRNGRRLVTVVMGAKHADGNDTSRFVETKKMLSYVFSNYQLYILKKDSQIKGVSEVKVNDGKQKSTQIVLQKDTGIWLRNDQKVTGELDQSAVNAPVNNGTKIGNIWINDIPAINDSHCVILPATVKNNVAEGNLIEKIFN